MQKREGEESADDHAEQDQQRVQYPGRGFRMQTGLGADVLPEKEIEGRDDAAGQQIILGNSEKVDLRESDQWQRNIASTIFTRSEKASISATVKTATEQGMTGEVIIGNERPRASEQSG